MITSNYLKEYGNYHSYLIEYLRETHNYDKETLLYSSKYASPAFTITNPTQEYKNCEFVNGYPHFQIPVEICMQEVNNFIEDKPIYDEDYIIRYGDMHPNKPMPMLGQMRNILLEDIYSRMIKTSGKVSSIFTIGDISEKTIKYFIDLKGYKEREKVLKKIFLGILNNQDLNNKYILAYQDFCEGRKQQTKSFLKQFDLKHDNLLFESFLYRNKALYQYIKKLRAEEGLKENREAKYLLQEFMFLLQEDYKNANMINIVGLDQSDHVKKVFDVIKENHLDCRVSFLNYNLCKSAESRKTSDWKSQIDKQVEQENMRLGDNLISYYDYIKFSVATNNCNVILDFNKTKIVNFNQVKEIYISLEKSKKSISAKETISINPLLSNMALVNQVFDSAVVSGESSRVMKYLYILSKEYNANQNEYSSMSDLYFSFMEKCLDSVSLSTTESFQKVLRRR